jgi:hypothetical protein
VSADRFFDITQGDWRVTADRSAEAGVARICFTHKGEPFREFDYLSYKVWNVAAHLHDIVTDFEQGMALASWPDGGTA